MAVSSAAFWLHKYLNIVVVKVMFSVTGGDRTSHHAPRLINQSMARTPVRKPEIKTLASSRRINARSGGISLLRTVPGAVLSAGIMIPGCPLPV
ncbi:hypothetical protein ACE2CL_004256, partial [Salmonella enterica]